MKRSAFILFFLLTSALFAAPRQRQAGLGTYVWGTFVTGDALIAGVKIPININLLKELKDADQKGALIGRAEASCGRWAGYLDVQYASLQNNLIATPVGLTVDVKLSFLLAEAAALYRLFSRNCFDVYAFASAYSFNYKVRVSRDLAATRLLNWIDPFIGLRVTRQWNQWNVFAHGAIGGFGLGSHFAWQAILGVRYHFCLWRQPVLVGASYRAIAHNYSKFRNGRKTGLDVVLHGPLVGLGVEF